ncbi:POTRA domain-containing protein [Erwinia mallotivora]|uniref:POTRA domain-containing protein n=1 Tax=Erwinia mallotivora TaxID=69222 RepID=UPI0035E8017F
MTTSVDLSITQQQRQQVLESQLNPSAKDVRFSLLSALVDGKIKFPEEENCYLIKAVLLEGTEALPGNLRLKSYARQAIGHCLGGQGINLLMKGLQNSIVAKGYITTRVSTKS